MAAPERSGSLLGTVKAVLWGFLGVRQRAEYEKDIKRLNPLHLVVVGMVMAFVFVGALIALVNWVAG
ncbi:DUF2970 domain-containing protein [Hydrogenophaga crocea]|uniref:DUF2970 domain-containing protein n=1 Tax=Hydrogenophaga crocea TaxID=2716225 RepID=A0A6G8IHY9_9BURK|nr:DUF2970 domain-containing protein [Hydrogenophaga crocea]QIM52814.1 DUF2970 domain-containing protein [Hydrogenophaga crocea]